MKRFSFIVSIFFFFLLLNQAEAIRKVSPFDATGKGLVELGGDLSFSHNSFDSDIPGDDFTFTEFTFSPRIGFFLTRNLELEPQFLFTSTDLDQEIGNDISENHFGILFNVAYNFDTQTRVVPFVNFGFGFLTNDFSEFPLDDNTSLIFPNLSVGLKTFLTQKNALRLEIKYTRYDDALGEDVLVNNSFSVGAGFSIFLGKKIGEERPVEKIRERRLRR